MLFSCQTREGGTFGVGMFNLTAAGQKMYLNAIDKMLGRATGITAKPGTVPSAYDLAQNYPNPFNPSTRIAFTLPAAGATRLSVYNMLGQEIAVLANGTYQAGTHEVVWNGCDSRGTAMPSGVYMYRLKSGESMHAKKMILMK